VGLNIDVDKIQSVELRDLDGIPEFGDVLLTEKLRYREFHNES
jgi:hypothetical protein